MDEQPSISVGVVTNSWLKHDTFSWYLPLQSGTHFADDISNCNFSDNFLLEFCEPIETSFTDVYMRHQGLV